MSQVSLFHDQEVKKLIAGKEMCRECGRKKRAYAKTLDKRLVAVLLKAVNYCEKAHSVRFDIFDVYGDSERLKADFRKLHYWGIVENTGRYRQYEITNKGWKFVMGNIRLPKIVWVWRDEVILSSESTVAIFEVEKRWQLEKSDYTFDYLPYPFATPAKVKMA